jgi:hypothetical protein
MLIIRTIYQTQSDFDCRHCAWTAKSRLVMFPPFIPTQQFMARTAEPNSKSLPRQVETWKMVYCRWKTQHKSLCTYAVLFFPAISTQLLPRGDFPCSSSLLGRPAIQAVCGNSNAPSRPGTASNKLCAALCKVSI